jgi:small subunit ribosomal protein S16
MLKMRLQRVGRKNDPSFRVIVTDSREGPKSGNNVDNLGSYSAKSNVFTVDGEKAKEWIAKGVQVSPTVHNLLVTHKMIEGKKINVLPKKSPIIDEEKIKAEAEAKAAKEAAAKAEAESAAAPAPEASPEETPTEEKIPETPAETEKAEETPAA